MTPARWLLLALLLALTVAMDVTEPEVTDWDAMGFYSAWDNAQIEYMERGGLSAREYSEVQP